MTIGLGCGCNDCEEGLAGILGDIPSCPAGYLWDGSQCYVSDVTPAQYQAAQATQNYVNQVASPAAYATAVSNAVQAVATNEGMVAITSNLVRDSSTGAIYYIANGNKYWVTDPTALASHGLTQTPQDVTPVNLLALPSGTDISDYDTAILPLIGGYAAPVVNVVNNSPLPASQTTQQQQVSVPATGTVSTYVTQAENVLQGNIAGIPIWMLGIGALGLLFLMKER